MWHLIFSSNDPADHRAGQLETQLYLGSRRVNKCVLCGRHKTVDKNKRGPARGVKYFAVCFQHVLILGDFVYFWLGIQSGCWSLEICFRSCVVWVPGVHTDPHCVGEMGWGAPSFVTFQGGVGLVSLAGKTGSLVSQRAGAPGSADVSRPSGYSCLLFSCLEMAAQIKTWCCLSEGRLGKAQAVC